MRAHPRSHGRWWRVTVGCIAAVLPVGRPASGTASAGGPAPGLPATPTVNADYLYSQLYLMSKAFSYRISGADGDPRKSTDAFNLPPTVNGWQELFAYWKAKLTDRRGNTKTGGVAAGAPPHLPRTGGDPPGSPPAPGAVPRAPPAGPTV